MKYLSAFLNSDEISPYTQGQEPTKPTKPVLSVLSVGSPRDTEKFLPAQTPPPFQSSESSRGVSLHAKPYINHRGELIIPFDGDPKYHWWAGGQSVAATLRELNAPREVWERYTDTPYGPVQ